MMNVLNTTSANPEHSVKGRNSQRRQRIDVNAFVNPYLFGRMTGFRNGDKVFGFLTFENSF